MPRLRLRDALACVDPRVRFDVAAGDGSPPRRLTARNLSRMRALPDDCGAPVYEVAEDDDSRVCIIICPPDQCEDHDAWLCDQLAHPVMRSVDCVDIFGNLIEGDRHV